MSAGSLALKEVAWFFLPPRRLRDFSSYTETGRRLRDFGAYIFWILNHRPFATAKDQQKRQPLEIFMKGYLLWPDTQVWLRQLPKKSEISSLLVGQGQGHLNWALIWWRLRTITCLYFYCQILDSFIMIYIWTKLKCYVIVFINDWSQRRATFQQHVLQFKRTKVLLTLNNCLLKCPIQ